MNCIPPPPCISVIPHVALFTRSKTYDYTPVEKMNVIAMYVARKTGIHPDQIFSKSRKRHIVLPRQIVFYLCSRWSVTTLKHIALHFGDIDHTTVIHSRTAIANLLETTDTIQWVSLLEMQGFQAAIMNGKY